MINVLVYITGSILYASFVSVKLASVQELQWHG